VSPTSRAAAATRPGLAGCCEGAKNASSSPATAAETSPAASGWIEGAAGCSATSTAERTVKLNVPSIGWASGATTSHRTPIVPGPSAGSNRRNHVVPPSVEMSFGSHTVPSPSRTTNPSPLGSASPVNTSVMRSTGSKVSAPSPGSDDSKPVCPTAGSPTSNRTNREQAAAATPRPVSLEAIRHGSPQWLNDDPVGVLRLRVG